jgi:hypothetical protein
MIQIYKPYHLWEDYKFGMWRKETKDYEEKNIDAIIDFTGDYKLYGNSMLLVIKEWPVSCEHNLTNLSLNRKAWLGHAACCIEHGWPEYLVRRAWGMLSEQQRFHANNFAQSVIDSWEINYKLKKNNINQLSLWIRE